MDSAASSFSEIFQVSYSFNTLDSLLKFFLKKEKKNFPENFRSFFRVWLWWILSIQLTLWRLLKGRTYVNKRLWPLSGHQVFKSQVVGTATSVKTGCTKEFIHLEHTFLRNQYFLPPFPLICTHRCACQKWEKLVFQNILSTYYMKNPKNGLLRIYEKFYI